MSIKPTLSCDRRLHRRQAAVSVILFAFGIATSPPSIATAGAVRHQIKSAILAADDTSIRLAFVHARSVRITSEAGATFGPPRIAPNRLRVGWPVMRAGSGSYATPVGIAVYVDGVRHDIGCDAGAPWAWRFAWHGLVVLKCAFPHGLAAASLQLVDVRTGKLRGHVTLVGDREALPAKAPAWARVALPE